MSGSVISDADLRTYVSTLEQTVIQLNDRLLTLEAALSNEVSSLSTKQEALQTQVGTQGNLITLETTNRANTVQHVDDRVSSLEVTHSKDHAYIVGLIEDHHGEQMGEAASIRASLSEERSERVIGDEAVLAQLAEHEDQAQWYYDETKAHLIKHDQALDDRTWDQDTWSLDDDEYTFGWSILASAQEWELYVSEHVNQLQLMVSDQLRKIESTVVQAQQEASQALKNTDINRLVDSLQGQIGIESLDAVLWGKVEEMEDAIAKEQAERITQITEEAKLNAARISAEAQALADQLSQETIERIDALAAEAERRAELIGIEAQERSAGLLAEAQARADAITQESLQRTAAISAEALQRAAEISAEALARADAISAESQARVDAINKEVADRTAALLAETNARNAAIQAERDARIQELNDKVAALTADYTARISQLNTDLRATIQTLSDGVTVSVSELESADASIITSLNAYKVSNNAAVAAVVDSVNTVTNAHSATVQRVDGLTASFNGLDAELAQTQADIVTANTLITTGDQALAEQISTLSASLDSSNASLQSGIDSVNTAVTGLDTATATKFADVNAKIQATDTKAGDAITAAANAQTTANSAVTTNTAQATEISNLKSRMTTTEGIVSTKADTTALNALTTQVEGLGTDMSVQADAITALEAELVTVDAKTDSAISSAAAAQNTANSAVTTNAAQALELVDLTARVTTTETNISKKADAIALSSLETKVDSNDAALSQRLDSLSAAITDLGEGAETMVDVYAFNALKAEVTNTQGVVSGHTTDISALQNTLNTVQATVGDNSTAITANSGAISETSSKVTSLEGTVASQGSSITSLQSGLATTNTNVTAAQNAANAANTLAGSKGKVLVQTTAPAAADRLAQNLWIDITNGANTPKRWNGSAWIAVTDKVATDAASAAANALSVANTKADASAFNALDTKVTTIEGTVTSHGSSITNLTNDLAATNSTVATKASTTALNALDTKVTEVDGKVATNTSAITALQSRASTIEGNVAKKLDASVINDYYTKTQSDASATTIAAGEVNKFDAKLVIGGANLYAGTNPIPMVGQTGTGEYKASSASTDVLQMYKYLESTWLDLQEIPLGESVITSIEIMVPSDSIVGEHSVRFATYRFGHPSYLLGAWLPLKNFPKDKWVRIAVPSGSLANVTASTQINISLYLSSRDVGTRFKWRNLMMEKGSRPSSYTDSDKVVQAALDANASAISNTTAEVTRIDGVVTAQGSSISKLQSDLTTTDTTANTALQNAATAQSTANTGVTKAEAAASSVSTLRTEYEAKALELADADAANAAAITKTNTDLTSAQTALSNTDQALGNRIDGLTTIVSNNLTTVRGEIQDVADSVTTLEGSTNTKFTNLESSLGSLNTTVGTKADASALSTLTTRVTNVEGVNTSQATSINTINSNITKLDELTRVMNSGKLVYTDPTFKVGNNSVSVYNNTNNGNVTITRRSRSADNPTTSTHELLVKTTGTASPNWGGIFQTINSRPNAVFLVKYIAKLPSGYGFVSAANALGNGASDKLYGQTSGTGKYETFYRITRCGPDGSFSTGGHLYVSGSPAPTVNTPLEWVLASIELYDCTDFQDAPQTVLSGIARAQSTADTAVSATQANANSINSLVTGLASLDTEVNGRIDTVAQSVTTLEGNTNTRINSLVSELDTVEGKADLGITNAANAQSTADTAVSKANANASDITALGSRLEVAETGLVTKASADALSALTTRVTNAEGVNTSQGTAITNLQNTINHSTTGLATKASTSALTAVDNKVTAANGRIDTTNSNLTVLTGRVDTVEGAVSTKADATALTNLTTRVTDVEGVNTSQGTAITTLQNTVNHATTGLSTKASTSALNTLDSKVTSIDGRVATNTSNISTLQGKVTTVENGLTTKLDASAINNYYTKTAADQAIAGKIEAFSSALVIGGSNLLRNSNFAKDASASAWASNGGGYTKVTDPVIGSVVQTNLPNGLAHAWLKLDNGVEYAYSALVKPTNTHAMSGAVPLHYHAGLNNTNQGKISILGVSHTSIPGGVWSRVWIRFTLTGDADSFRPFIYGGAANTIQVAWTQLERGSKPTDWSPSPQDVQNQLDVNATAISNVYTKAETNSAITNATDTVKAQLDQNIATQNSTINAWVERNKVEAVMMETLAAELVPHMAGNTELFADMEINAGYQGVITALADTDASIVGRIDEMQSRYDNALASIGTSAGVRTTAEEAAASMATTIRAEFQAADTATANAASTALTNALQNYTTTAALQQNYYTKTGADTAISNATTTLQSSMRTEYTNAINAIDLATVTIPDTRNDNQTPQWYWTNYARKKITEFKFATTVGLTTALVGNTYGTLTTIVPWTDSSGGPIRQIMEGSSEANVYVRVSTGTTTWGPWTKQGATLDVKIQEQTQAVNGIKGIKTVTIDNNGVMSGYGLISELQNGQVTSAFGVNADQFYVGSPASGKKVFAVVNGVTVINDAVIGNLSADKITTGTLHGDRITVGTLKGDRIVGNTIDASKLNVTDLSAISANLGTIQVDTANIANGAITTAKIGDLQVDTLKIKGNAVTTPQTYVDANSDMFSITSLNTWYTISTFRVTDFSGNGDALVFFKPVPRTNGGSAYIGLNFRDYFESRAFEYGLFVDGVLVRIIYRYTASKADTVQEKPEYALPVLVDMLRVNTTQAFCDISIRIRQLTDYNSHYPAQLVRNGQLEYVALVVKR